MLDLGFVRDNLEFVKQKMGERGLGDSLGSFEAIDRERRKFLVEAETRKARRNKEFAPFAVNGFKASERVP